MTSAMRDPDGLERPELLRRLAELDRLEPPPQLDDAVMERARRVTRPARAPRLRHPLRWAATAALTAALAAFAVSTTLRPPAVAARREAALSHSPGSPHAGVGAYARDAARADGPLRAAAPLPAPRLEDVSLALHAPIPPALLIATGLPSVPFIPSEHPRSSFIATDAHSPGLVVSVRRADVQSHPAQWLGWIRWLRAEGRTEEADREMTAFTRIYPGYPRSSSGPVLETLDSIAVARPDVTNRGK